MISVYTIGYEGTDIERFVSTLKAVDVRLVADVRALALSRKRGFSKTALKARLAAEGILYEHFVRLGDPKPGREAARSGRYDEFRAIYARHLASPEAQRALWTLNELVSRQPSCLLCFEREPRHCHRTIIADQLKKYGKRIFDLYGDAPRQYDDDDPKLARRHFGESAAST
jgi:uncharacterized protein (DUF488 family)